MLNFNLVILF